MENKQIMEEKVIEKNNYFLILIPLFLIFIFLILFFINNQKPGNKSTKEIVVENISEVAPTPMLEKKSTGLGYPVVRVAKYNYHGWKEYKSTKSNLAIYYPSSWFVDESTVFSWNPASVERPLPLQSKDSKWDMDLVFTDDSQRPENIADVFDAHSEAQNYHLFEVTKTADGWPVYIATVELAKADPESFLGGHDYLRAVVITPNGMLSWAGFAGTEVANSAETLKQIVESLHYSE